MKKLKNVAPRFFILCICIGLMISYNSCISDEKDKDLTSIQTFLEKHNGSKWTVIENDMRIYIKLNQDADKDLEVWVSELELAKLLSHKECFYYSQEKLNTEEEEDFENFGSQLAFTDLDDETLTFSMDGDRLKLAFETTNNVNKVIYFSETKENVAALDICPKERTVGAFDWRVLK